MKWDWLSETEKLTRLSQRIFALKEVVIYLLFESAEDFELNRMISTISCPSAVSPVSRGLSTTKKMVIDTVNWLYSQARSNTEFYSEKVCLSQHMNQGDGE